jgi:hypothetical protein
VVTAVDHPLRLAVGSHEAGSGMGCAMNVISWESGDTTITDLPACADSVLARIVQRVNDSICTHRDGDLLCPACSVKVLDLAHRIVGTGTHPLTEMERRRVWVRVAADQARQVLHLTSAPEALAAIEAAEGWCDGTVTAEQCRIAATATTANTANAAAAAAANAAAHANAANTANAAAAAAANAAAVADVGEAAGRAANATVCAIYAAAYVIYAAAYVAHAAYAAERLRLAHRAVDVWCEWAGFTPAAPEPVIVTKAIEQMLQVAQ